MTVRSVQREELHIIWCMIKYEPFGIDEDQLIEIYNESPIFLCIEDITKGFGFAINYIDDNYELFTYISEDYRRQGLGTELFKTLENQIHKKKDSLIRVENMLDYYDASHFLNTLGYSMWYSSSLLGYDGDLFDDPGLELTNYSDEYYTLCYQLRTEAFFQVRKENDIKPYRVPSCQKEQMRMNKSKDNYHLHFDGENLVGVLKVQNDFVDLLMIHKDYRGKGYGKKLLQMGTNMILNNGYSQAKLYIMDTNTNARRLYESQGYEIQSTVHVYQKYID